MATLSLLTAYDNLIRDTLVLTTSPAEPEFIKFAQNQEECRKRWLAAEGQVANLLEENKKLKKENAMYEGKLSHARRLVDEEKKRRFIVESELNAIEQQLELVKEVVGQGKCQFYDDTKDKLAFLNASTKSRRSSNYATGHRNMNQKLNTINEDMDSTGSLLSDLSYSRSEDNLDLSYRKRWKNPELSPQKEAPTTKRQRRSISRTIDVDGAGTDKIVTTTTVTVDKRGPVTATAKIEKFPDQDGIITTSESEGCMFVPSAPVLPSSTEGSLECLSTNVRDQLANELPQEMSPNIGVFALGMNQIINKKHHFCEKSNLKPDICGPCNKKLLFGRKIAKCRDCRTAVHLDCKDQVPLPCVPVGNTPKGKGVPSTIADFAPAQPPMVPSIIVHCCKEIERRGLNEQGIYRIPAVDKDVKALKEKFFRGKGSPNLSNIDVHVLCSTVKSFLRSLREPLVTYIMWGEFIRASEIGDVEDARAALYQAISELPHPNRDTLAFIMLHLQRVAETRECQMPISNLSLVFGPCIIGYSSENPSQQELLDETRKQQRVLEHMLNIPSEYWVSLLENFRQTNGQRTPLNRGLTSQPSSASLYRGFFNSQSLRPRTHQGKFFDSPSFPS